MKKSVVIIDDELVPEHQQILLFLSSLSNVVQWRFQKNYR